MPGHFNSHYSGSPVGVCCDRFQIRKEAGKVAVELVRGRVLEAERE